MAIEKTTRVRANGKSEKSDIEIPTYSRRYSIDININDVGFNSWAEGCI